MQYCQRWSLYRITCYTLLTSVGPVLHFFCYTDEFFRSGMVMYLESVYSKGNRS